jgi:Glycosyl transferases group 1
MRVAFFLHGESRLDALKELDPERDFGEFQTGERAWILQTYLRLRRAGYEVELTDRWPQRGLLVFSSKQRRIVKRLGGRTDEVRLLGVREDVGVPWIADWEVLQNGRYADGRKRFLVPLWPQPGLIPRDASRGHRIRRAGYKGFIGNLHKDFHGERWARFLAERGIDWTCDAPRYAGSQRDRAVTGWNDYREIDLIVAIRPADRALHVRKPAAKLYNGWLAGVPALLGQEYALRELRRSDEDYIEISSLGEAMQAVSVLLEQPERYAAMIANARRRAIEFTSEAILRQWAQLLFQTLPAREQDPHVRHWSGRPLWLKAGVRRILRS